MLNIEVAYATAHKQKIYLLEMVSGSTARDAALAAPICTDFPDAQPYSAPLGVFGKRVPDDYILREYDRVEVYRPLHADPKEARRQRVRQQTESFQAA